MLGPSAIEQVQPLEGFIFSKEGLQVNVWLGKTGLKTYLHFDSTHNFFIQLQGRKRFFLFPPNSTLYAYPVLHPHSSHSQVNLTRPRDSLFYTQFPQINNTLKNILIVDVERGDVLYIPPFWWHEVETLADSVSVNVWSESSCNKALNAIYALPIPIDDFWVPETLLWATELFLKTIVEKSLFVGAFSKLIKDLVVQRYENLVVFGKLHQHYDQGLFLGNLCRSGTQQLEAEVQAKIDFVFITYNLTQFRYIL